MLKRTVFGEVGFGFGFDFDSMKKKEEKKQKFHEALLCILYPPPPFQEDEDNVPVNRFREDLNVDQDHCPDTDELEGEMSSPSSSSDEGECGTQKLTRAQRKRLRKKKLKEASTRRRKIIGPLRPSASDDAVANEEDVLQDRAQGVRHNVAEGPNDIVDKPGGPASSSSKNKLRHRRVAKRMGRENSKKPGIMIEPLETEITNE